jgi:retron-type reverse transcriptase
MRSKSTVETAIRLRWRDAYREVELYKAAVRVYTKPLFHWRKALNVSADGKTLYELAGRGLRGLDAIHNALVREQFQFRPAVGLQYNFNGKRRTLYIPPWEERIVDLVLYRVLNQRLHRWFSPSSYAYRDRTYGLDSCQSQIARLLRSSREPLYLVKRDISDYFASINHEILLRQLSQHVDPDDYLFQLLQQRVRFVYQNETGTHQAAAGIPFGCASACVFANIYLTALDRAVAEIPGVHYFRYADDLLLLSPERERALLARERLSRMVNELKLSTKPSHEADLRLSPERALDQLFKTVEEFRHLGLLFRAGGEVSLSRDKRRKIQNLFRFAFRRKRRTWKKVTDPKERARTLAAIARDTIEDGVRNVAIIDYYLKHVTAVAQLQLLDRWLAEEVLSLVFGGHKKGHFAKLSFETLRELGLPSLVHRQRLIVHGQTKSPFFVWQEQKSNRAFRGTVARLVRTVGKNQSSLRAQKQQPTAPVREGGCL